MTDTLKPSVCDSFHLYYEHIPEHGFHVSIIPPSAMDWFYEKWSLIKGINIEVNIRGTRVRIRISLSR